MKKEMKICLPFYKIAYSIFFVAILSVIRGVSFTYEIGIALEAPLAMLAVVFCADTYVQEILSNRSEVERLCPMKNRMALVARRMAIQQICLLLLAVAGYGMFLIVQKPLPFYGEKQGAASEQNLFFLYVAAIVVTLNFWGILSHTLASFFRNMWVGIGLSLMLWIVTNSYVGKRFFGSWNVFSYTFRNIENSRDVSWLCGKMLGISLCIIMAGIFPLIMKKRG